ncbi:MAG: tRNA (adenosine(37)-N6)-threonylcarbamoyltransferase complex ATPase subunit type 1 TsaE [Bacteroidetes bacterium 46-16]|nr:MAG: tRNA (adenosine(37)-N6)-threonylcarbamoyltransferase complex ATPase subunit type 1 TsaE [Bacteroidetes bacterium 46-16]
MADLILNLSYSLEDIKTAADKFWAICKNYKVLAFSGELGAGKTTFIHALCEQLGVQDNVSSPTFALVNEYHYTDARQGTEETIYHMDWYRLKSTEEAINAGMEDNLAQGDVHCFVEWPEKATELLPTPYLWISINTKNETGREMRVYIHE